MKSWKRTIIVTIGILFLGTFSACGGKTEDIWKPKEPTTAQIVLLEKVYDELRTFTFLKDGVPFEWQGPEKERFDILCGEKTEWNIPLEIENYQKPEETLKKRGGDCEDFAILFVSAAKSLGVSARAVHGKVKPPQETYPRYHVWVEIYYQGEWRLVNPLFSLEGMPFNGLMKNPEKLYLVETSCRYDDKIIVGPTPLAQLEITEGIFKKGTANSFCQALKEAFQTVRKREANPAEIREMKEIADWFAAQHWQITKRGVPADPRLFIQPDNSAVKAWIEKIKRS